MKPMRRTRRSDVFLSTPSTHRALVNAKKGDILVLFWVKKYSTQNKTFWHNLLTSKPVWLAFLPWNKKGDALAHLTKAQWPGLVVQINDALYSQSHNSFAWGKVVVWCSCIVIFEAWQPLYAFLVWTSTMWAWYAFVLHRRKPVMHVWMTWGWLNDDISLNSLKHSPCYKRFASDFYFVCLCTKTF